MVTSLRMFVIRISESNIVHDPAKNDQSEFVHTYLHFAVK